MNPREFVEGLRLGGGMEFADDVDPDYCPVHAWDHSYIGGVQYHEDECPAYAAHLAKFIKE
jgi:hypothetical protein